MAVGWITAEISANACRNDEVNLPTPGATHQFLEISRGLHHSHTPKSLRSTLHWHRTPQLDLLP